MLFALGAGARFIARSIDTNQKHLPVMLKRAHAYKGAAFVEIFQNCIVYNDAVFANFTEKDVAADMQIELEDGKPMIFGKEKNKGLRLKKGKIALEVVTIGENGVTEADILVHDETDKVMAGLLAAMEPPDFPKALGVLYSNEGLSYETAVHAQIAEVTKASPPQSLNQLLRRGNTWTVS